MKNKEKESTVQTPAVNERFGASGAVPPQTNRTKNTKSYPAEKSWKPRLRQAAGTLYAIWTDNAVETAENETIKT